VIGVSRVTRAPMIHPIRLHDRLGANLGRVDLTFSVISRQRHTRPPLTPASVHAVRNEAHWYVAHIPRYIRIQWASDDSKASGSRRYPKLRGAGACGRSYVKGGGWSTS
jgi:hypothetical protein